MILAEDLWFLQYYFSYTMLKLISLDEEFCKRLPIFLFFKFILKMKFILYSRSYCHLCEDMLLALGEMNLISCPIEVIDIDQETQFLEKYDVLVPVLVGVTHRGDVEELCHYYLDKVRVESFLKVQET